ncbi:hypothetical protein BaRGS_00022570 [Batillaria attramentaria]|uniref:Uncharacterized protein n=1 Tax=Batillaria attramentaria TaxID=370345 RepID=A0ABD0KH75_9CAEN
MPSSTNAVHTYCRSVEPLSAPTEHRVARCGVRPNLSAESSADCRVAVGTMISVWVTTLTTLPFPLSDSLTVSATFPECFR